MCPNLKILVVLTSDGVTAILFWRDEIFFIRLNFSLLSSTILCRQLALYSLSHHLCFSSCRGVTLYVQMLHGGAAETLRPLSVKDADAICLELMKQQSSKNPAPKSDLEGRLAIPLVPLPATANSSGAQQQDLLRAEPVSVAQGTSLQIEAAHVPVAFRVPLPASLPLFGFRYLMDFLSRHTLLLLLPSVWTRVTQRSRSPLFCLSASI